MRFAVIGSGNIVDHFIAAGRKCEGFELCAVYSRNLARAREFADKHGAPLAFDSLSQLAQCDQVDAVYVASPNYAHCEQAIQMMSAGKHVLCEKPLASNAGEVRRMQACASGNNVVLLEAMKPVFEPSFAVLTDALTQLGVLRRVTATYCQYSSRYDQFKQGVVLNAFDPALSNGALMDIGVYCVHPVVKLFGMPKRIHATAIKLHNGVDGAGSIQMDYGDFQADLMYSKIADGLTPSEFQGEEGSLLVARFSVPQQLTLCLRNQPPKLLETVQEPQSMRFEIEAFMHIVDTSLSTAVHDKASLDAALVMDEARRQTGIVFPADA